MAWELVHLLAVTPSGAVLGTAPSVSARSGTLTVRSITMYDMYPEWGPAKHDPQHPASPNALQTALDLRDRGGPQPDDN